LKKKISNGIALSLKRRPSNDGEDRQAKKIRVQ
jgi:hypothetical protein